MANIIKDAGNTGFKISARITNQIELLAALIIEHLFFLTLAGCANLSPG
jgi:hypothetical protein